MDDLISPNASRGVISPSSSSFSGDSYSTSSDEDHSVTDLTYHFDRHTLQAPWLAGYLEPPSDLSDCHSPRTFRDTSSPQDYLRLVRQQRQSSSRRQCSPAHLSRVSTLVGDKSQDDNSCCTTLHPFSQGSKQSSGALRQSSRGFERPIFNTLPQRVSNRSTPTFGSAPTATASSFEYSEVILGRCSKPQHLYKIVKEPRHIHLGQRVRRKPVIEKDIRMRRRTAG